MAAAAASAAAREGEEEVTEEEEVEEPLFASASIPFAAAEAEAPSESLAVKNSARVCVAAWVETRASSAAAWKKFLFFILEKRRGKHWFFENRARFE